MTKYSHWFIILFVITTGAIVYYYVTLYTNLSLSNSNNYHDYYKIYNNSLETFATKNSAFVSPEYQTKLLEPVQYYKDMAGKNIRKQIIEYFGKYYKVDKQIINIVSDIINDFHNISLVLDDIQDNSPMRRNHKSAHIVYGIPFSLGAANLNIFKNLFEYSQQLSKIEEPKYAYFKKRKEFKDVDESIIKQIINHQILIKIIELMYLTNLGQQMDVYWAHKKTLPTIEEYEFMIQNKTGNLFFCVMEICSNMSDHTHTKNDYLYFKDKITKLCSFFQIRDDYVNITDLDYWHQKGFCEDFDEKKYSYVVVRFLHSDIITSKIKTKFMRIFNKKKVTKQNKIKMLHILDQTKILDEIYTLLTNLLREIEFIEISFDKLLFKKFDIQIIDHYFDNIKI